VHPGAVKDLTTEKADLAVVLASIVVEDDTGDAEKNIAILEQDARTSESVPRLINNGFQVEGTRLVPEDLLCVPDHWVVIQLLGNLNEIVVQIEWSLYANFGCNASRCTRQVEARGVASRSAAVIVASDGVRVEPAALFIRIRL